jgi:hypothetical protein
VTDTFQALIDKHRTRICLLRDALDLDGRLVAVSSRDPTYSIGLTRNSDTSSAWRVTSFRGKEPVGHCEYDRLDGGSPIQNALQEFAGDDFTFIRRTIPKRERERRIREAHEGLAACSDAITKTPDEAGNAIFERSQRIWQKRLAALIS